jgi:thiol-disulfide isomerase/thioredoxin
MSRWVPIGIATILLLAVANVAAADPPGLKILPIGSPAPDFSLLVVIFTCNHCPTAQAYDERIIKLHADYKDKGVALVAISPNDPKAVRLDELGYTDLSDSFEEMKLRAKDRKFEFPYLYDGETQKTSIAYGVLATPQVFIFDTDRKLRYVGGIDDSDVREVKSHYTRDALDALLAGRPVAKETSRVFGCSTKWADKRDDARKSLEKWDKEPVTLASIDEEGVAKLANNEGKDLLVVNVWATWCGPCVTELPEFVTMNRMYRKRDFKLVTISMDDPVKEEAALKVLKDLHVSATNYILGFKDRDKFAELLDKEWPGPLPHTLVIAPGGKVLYRKTGAMDALTVKRAIVGYLGRTYATKGTDASK